MQAEPHIELECRLAGTTEHRPSRSRRVDVIQDVAAFGMSHQREELTADAERPDAEPVTGANGPKQSVRVVSRNAPEVREPGRGRQAGDVPVGGGAKADRMVEKLTAETETQAG